MTISASDLSGASSVASSAAQAAAATRAANQSISQKQFLTLFIEQLKSQDPLSPMDPDQLTAQLAQFSSLEQLTNINTKLESLQDSTESNTSTAMLNLLGRTVTFDGNSVRLKSGEADPTTFTLDQAATDVTAVVKNAQGVTVRTIDLGPMAKGDHEFAFDGKSATGSVLPDGDYTIALTADIDGSKDPVAVSLRMQGTVDGIDFTSSPATVTVLGQHIPLDKVREVRPSTDSDA